MKSPKHEASKERFTYKWTANGYEIEVVYELQPDWEFVSKQIVITRAPAASYRVNDVEVFREQFAETPASSYTPSSTAAAGSQPSKLGTGDSGVFVRFQDKRGLLATAQNPFLRTTVDGALLTVGYAPEIEWRADYGPFTADRGLLAPYHLSGRMLPATMTPEWAMPSDAAPAAGMDQSEVAAFTELVRSFLLYRPASPLNVMVGWCANDYQIDVATEGGREEYRRIIDRAAELGAHTCSTRRRTRRCPGARTASTTGAGSTCSGSAWVRRFGPTSGT